MILRFYLFLPIFILFSIITVLFTPELLEDGLRAEPDLDGPEGICLSAASGFAYAEYTAGGNPSDVFNWSIKDASGFEVYSSAGQGVDKITFAYSVVGNYQVNLTVYRGSDQNYYSKTMDVIVQNGPVFNMPPDVVLCGNDAVTITAISDDPELNPDFSQFSFEWTDQAGTVVSEQNELTITEQGRYFVTITTPACVVQATTFAGPSIEVEVTPSTTVACLGQNVSYTPDVPISASWSYQKSGQSNRTPLGKFFSLNLNTDNLEGLGDYTIFFNAEDQNNPGCSVEHSFPLQVNEGAEFTLTKNSDADGCATTEGSFTIKSVSQLDDLTVEGVPGATYQNLSPNEEVTISGLSAKTYVVRGTLKGCSVSRLISIDNLNFGPPIEYSVKLVEEAGCSPSGLEGGTISLTFDDGPGTYSIYSSKGKETLGSFVKGDIKTEDLPGGEYKIEVRDGSNCTSPNVKTEEVPSPKQVSFSVPTSLTACEFFEFSPESEQDLYYVFTAPDGSPQAETSTNTFIVEESGTYSITATDNDPNSKLCPRRRYMEVTVDAPLEFDYSQRIIDCYGNEIFSAELGSKKASEVIIRWRDEAGDIVGREREFYPPSTGNFTLDVQPRASSKCSTVPIPFEVTVPSLENAVTIEATPFCGDDAFSTLTAEVELKDNLQLQWFFTDSAGQRSELLEHVNKEEIDVADEGNYEVIVRRLEEPMCELARASYDLVKSEGIVLDLEDEYQICTEEYIFPVIDPGTFASYTWTLDGEVVDSLATLRPSVPGSYKLEVADSLGCEASASFEVTERCITLARFPNAIMPYHPKRDFRVYLDPLIDHVEVLIYNRMGGLVFHCESAITAHDEPYCIWDGTTNGKPAPIGSYPLIIRFSSETNQIQEELRRTLLVIE